MPILPEQLDEQAYFTKFKDDTVWEKAIQTICKRHGLSTSKLLRQKTGSAIVYETEGRIIKLYAPLWPEEVQREFLGLEHCKTLDLPIPKIEHSGQLENWDYIVMNKLQGDMIRNHWSQLELKTKASLMRQAGEIMKSFHSLPPIENPCIDLNWNDYVKKRWQEFPDQQRKFGLAEEWIEPFTQWLIKYSQAIPIAANTLLHCDLTSDHFLIDQVNDEWKITGLIDFADAMKGHYLYEFAAPLVFLTAGEISLRRELLLSYGFKAAELTDELAHHLFACILLHRFSNVPWYIKQLPHPLTKVEDLVQYLCQLNI